MSAGEISLNTSFPALVFGGPARVAVRQPREVSLRVRAQAAAAELPGSRFVAGKRHPVTRVEQALFLALGSGFLFMAGSFALQFLQ